MRIAHYFVAAAIVLLLGASAMPVGLAAYAIAESSSGPYAVAAGAWSGLVMIVAVGGPIALTIGGIAAIWRRHD